MDALVLARLAIIEFRHYLLAEQFESPGLLCGSRVVVCHFFPGQLLQHFGLETAQPCVFVRLHKRARITTQRETCPRRLAQQRHYFRNAFDLPGGNIHRKQRHAVAMVQPRHVGLPHRAVANPAILLRRGLAFQSFRHEQI